MSDLVSVSDTDASDDRMAGTAAENATVGIQVYAFDPDGDAVSYAVDDAWFPMDPDGTVRVAAGASFDAETEASVTINVTATSSDGSTSSQAFTLGIVDVNEHDIGAISDSEAGANGLAESARAGDTVGIVALAIDADATAVLGYATDDARFRIDPHGTVRVAAGADFDFETEPSVTFNVIATSSDGTSTSQGFTLDVGDVNEAPTLLALDPLEISENDAGGIVGNLSVTDPDAGDSHDFSVSDARFKVVDGALQLLDCVALDHETEAEVSLVVSVSDAGGLGRSQSFSISVVDEFEYVRSAQNDLIIGDGAANDISGDAGNDVIIGHDGDDRLIGNSGDDRLRSGAGADVLIGGIGFDMLDYRFSWQGGEVDLRSGIGRGGDAEGDRVSGFPAAPNRTGQPTSTRVPGGRRCRGRPAAQNREYSRHCASGRVCRQRLAQRAGRRARQ